MARAQGDWEMIVIEFLLIELRSIVGCRCSLYPSLGACSSVEWAAVSMMFGARRRDGRVALVRESEEGH
jgi:hypothetical protein